MARKPTPADPALDDSEKDELNYVQFVNSAWKAADDTWRPRRVVFDESWALFWNRYDFSKKAPWQSKNFSPKMNRMVRQAVYSFKSALVGVTDFFSVDGVGKKSKERAWVVAKIVKYWLDKNNFVSQAVDSMFSAMLSSLMVFKIYAEHCTDEQVSEPARAPKSGAEKVGLALSQGPEQPHGALPAAYGTVKRTYLKIRIDAVDPNHMRLDPTGRNKYKIHEFKMDLHDLKELAKTKANKYEQDVVEKIEEDYRKQEEEIREKARKGEVLTAEQNRAWRKEVVLREYWGETFDEKGNLLGRNMTLTIANEKDVIRKPFKNPYLPDEDPFVVGAPLRVPFSSLHQSFAENINGLCRIATEILNLTLDANLWASIKAFELDLDQVVDPNEFKNGVYPGKVFKKRARGVPRQMLTPLEMGMVNPQNLQFGGAVEREVENATGVNEFSAGFQGARKNELATEINVKGAQSESYLNSIAGEVEENVFDKVLAKLWKMVLAHQDNFEDEQLVELLGEDVSNILVSLSDAGRKEYLGGKYEFLFRGMSSMLQKGKDLEKCQMVSQAMMQNPGAAQFINLPVLIRKFFDSLNWNPEEFMLAQPGTPPPGAPSAAVPQPGAAGAPGGAVAPPAPGAPPNIAALLAARALAGQHLPPGAPIARPGPGG